MNRSKVGYFQFICLVFFFCLGSDNKCIPFGLNISWMQLFSIYFILFFILGELLTSTFFPIWEFVSSLMPDNIYLWQNFKTCSFPLKYQMWIAFSSFYIAFVVFDYKPEANFIMRCRHKKCVFFYNWKWTKQFFNDKNKVLCSLTTKYFKLTEWFSTCTCIMT